MSIKKFFKPEIINVAKDILQHGKWLGFQKAGLLTENDSFRETLDMSSLDIAELIVELEERYHVHMEWVDTNTVDSLNDIYNAFVSAITKMRKTAMTLNAIQNQK